MRLSSCILLRRLLTPVNVQQLQPGSLLCGLTYPQSARGYSSPSSDVEASYRDADRFSPTQPDGVRLHIPVLVDKIVELINPQDGQVIVDMTFGAGGHTRALLSFCSGITVYALDRDPTANNIAQKLSQTCPQVIPLLGRFTDMHDLLNAKNIVGKVDAVLFDVGASSMQFDNAERGFSLSRDGPLDMRMDRIAGRLTAEDVVNNMSEDGLRGVIKTYGEEKRARDIARAIVDSRYAFGRIRTTAQLANIVAGVYDGSHIGRDSLDRPSHPATKTFQALRIFVNDELNELYNGLQVAHGLLRPSGLCTVISFHSLEDRIVKRDFHGQDIDERANMSITDRHRNPTVLHSEDDVSALLRKRWRPAWRGALTPADEEIARNPRARSAKLRAAWKL